MYPRVEYDKSVARDEIHNQSKSIKFATRRDFVHFSELQWSLHLMRSASSFNPSYLAGSSQLILPRFYGSNVSRRSKVSFFAL